MKGTAFLKVTSILLIIGGIIAIIAGIVALLAVGTMAALLGSSSGAGLLYLASVLALLSGVIELIAGIKGVKACKVPLKAASCIVWGVIIAVFSVVGQIINIAAGSTFSVVNLFTGLILPVLYIVGASMMKSAAAGEIQVETQQ